MRVRQKPNLEIHLGFVFSEGRNTGEQRLALDPGLCEDQEQGPDEGEVPEQKLQVPQDTVRDRL